MRLQILGDKRRKYFVKNNNPKDSYHHLNLITTMYTGIKVTVVYFLEISANMFLFIINNSSQSLQFHDKFYNLYL